MSSAPVPQEFDGRDRLARLEGIVTSERDRRAEMDELHRTERREQEARVMAAVQASEDRTGKRIDGVIAKVDATNTKIDGLVAALTTGRSATPANTDDTGGGASTFATQIKVQPWMWKALLAALAGGGIVGGGLRAVTEKPAPAQTVNVTSAP